MAAQASRTNGAARRDEILAAAFAQLVANGFEGLRVRDVARAVGINQATLLYHFRDKEALIVALVDELIGRFRAVNQARYAVVPGSFASFEAHLDTLCELFAASPEMYVALNEIAARAMRDAAIAHKIAAVEEGWAAYIGTLLRAAAPAADDADIVAGAQATVAFFRGVSAKAAGDGTLATLVARGKGRRIAARRVRAVMTTYATFVRSAFTRSEQPGPAALR